MFFKKNFLHKEIIQAGRFIESVNAMKEILTSYRGQVLSCGILPEFTSQYTNVLFKGFCHICVMPVPNRECHLAMLKLVRISINSRAFPRKVSLFCLFNDK